MKKSVKEMYERFGFVVTNEDNVVMPNGSYDVDEFVFDTNVYDDDLTDAEVAKLFLELAEQYEKYFHEIKYALGHIVDKLEEE